MKITAAVIHIPAALSQSLDESLQSWVRVVDIHHSLAVQPVLDLRAPRDNPSRIPFPDRLGSVLRRLERIVERRGVRAGVFAVTMPVVVENLILILPRTVINAAVPALGDLPLKAQFEIIRNGLTRVIDPAALPRTSDSAVPRLPVATGTDQPLRSLPLKMSLKPAAFSSGVRVFGAAFPLPAHKVNKTRART